MQRRIALAVSFVSTVIVVFAMVAMGRQAGLFGGDAKAAQHGPTSQPGSPDDVAAALRYLAAINQPPPTPDTATQYVYVDVPGSPQVTYLTRTGQSAPTGGDARPTPTPVSRVAPTPPPQPTAAAPTAGPPTLAPQPTAPPASPVPPSPAPAPTKPPSSGRELEFTGTVGSVDGNVVTFTHDGTTTAVTVSSRDLARLQPGVRAKVHAKSSEGSWVAKEIEIIH